MDFKNTFIGILFVVAAIFAYFASSKSVPPAPVVQSAPVAQAAAAEKAAPVAPVSSDPLFVAPKTTEVKTHVLENDFIRVVFTTEGGAIQQVILKRFPENAGTTEPPVEFNKGACVNALAFGKGSLNNADSSAASPAYIHANFKLVESTPTSVRFALDLPSGLRLERFYSIAAVGETSEPYLIAHKTTLENRGHGVIPGDVLWLNIGLLPPTESDTIGDLLSVGYYNGKDDEFTASNVFKDSKGFFGFGSHAAKPYVVEGSDIVWGAVRNQFFSTILTAKGERRALKLFAKAEPIAVHTTAAVDAATQAVLGAHAQAPAVQKGIVGALSFAGKPLNPGEGDTLEVSYYVGPKEYVRLDRLGERQDLVMGFGFFTGFISKAMLLLLIGVHSLVVSVSPAWGWGWSIILVTVIIKLLIWPLTGIQTRSAKRMAKIQEPLKALREQFKDNPQRMQQETLKLFRENKVNPVAGCLPLFIQLPIFIGLYYMLRSASELRYAPFLWFNDLSMPETVGHLWGIPVHILPFLMTATMMLQMRLTPTPSTDPIQRRMFQFMPLIFFFICYSFPSGLVLYWTVQNVFTIFQQWVTNRSKDDVAPPSDGKTLTATAQRMAPIKVARKGR